MRKVKSVETLSDVTCENCTSYNQGRCCQDLPAISVEPGNKCIKGYWLFQENVIDYRFICWKLLAVSFVTDVEDLACKNCVSYDPSRKECHYERLNIYKTDADDWCNHGTFLEERDDNFILPAFFVAYEDLIASKDNEKRNLKVKRIVKSVETFSDVTCKNCITYNEGRCCYTLPFVPVGPEDKCHEGQWLHKGKLLGYYGVPPSFVKDIEDLKCGECIFYDSSKEECHFHRRNVYKSGPNDWCDNGEWAYQDNDEANYGSLSFLYSKFIESKDNEKSN